MMIKTHGVTQNDTNNSVRIVNSDNVKNIFFVINKYRGNIR